MCLIESTCRSQEIDRPLVRKAKKVLTEGEIQNKLVEMLMGNNGKAGKPQAMDVHQRTKEMAQHFRAQAEDANSFSDTQRHL